MKTFSSATKASLTLLSLAIAALVTGASSPKDLQSSASERRSAVTGSTKPSAGPLDRASWIWRKPADDVCQVRTAFTIDQPPVAASIFITADNGYELYINGALVGFDIGAGGEIWSSVERYDIQSRLARGHNVIGIRGTDLGGVRGLIAAVRIEIAGQSPVEIVTDSHWRTALNGDPVDYSHPEFVETSEWTDATVIGPMGQVPWGKLAYNGSTGGRRPKGLESSIILTQPAPDFSWPEGLIFVGDDCSVYVPLRGDAWGLCFRVGDWSRAYTEFDIPCPSKIGRKLYSLKPVAPGAKPRLLVDAGRGAIGSPAVSYDGKSILFAMAPDGGSFFHIYRIPSEGGVPVRLTDGPFHDIDPAELPDGRIVFVSTRIGSFEEYHNPPSRALFVMKPDGTEIEPITFTPIFDNEPKVLADGRIAFIRTDNFFDRAKVETQLHVIRPDGTDGLTEIGAEVGADYGVRLRAFGYGSPAPLPDGRLACISSRGNFIASLGALEQSFHQLPGGLGDLTAMPDGRLLATVLRPDGKRMNSDVIAVIDPSDNRVVSIHESANGSVHSPVFLGRRTRPPVIPDYVESHRSGTTATGFLLCQDVRFTKKTRADWRQIHAIRVLGAIPLTTRSSHSHIVHAGHETVELGTVPIAPDGSFFVEVPADTPLALQAVDAEGRSELNEMSWIYVRPGERRSCLGCHNPRQATPPMANQPPQALRAPPLKLLGQGRAHRFRGNNAGVTGMMDVQFERFRETASLNRHANESNPGITGTQEVEALIQQLAGTADEKIAAAQHLAIFRDRTAALALAGCLKDENREVRVAAAIALSACGTRDSAPALLNAMEDRDPVAATAAKMALANLVGGNVAPFNAFVALEERKKQAQAWRGWFQKYDWDAIERTLLPRMRTTHLDPPRRAIVALGHIGSDAARSALRNFVAVEKENNPYPAFVKDNRTDTFTFGADSPLNPRTLQEAVRALGHLKDIEAIPMLRDILAKNTDPKTANLFLAEAAVEALGRIGTPEAESALIAAFRSLKEYWHYVGWYSDHPALYACHNSPLHARIIEALDAIGSTRTHEIVPHLIRSAATDPDRALFPHNDDYETLVGRVIGRSGRGDELIETCLWLLGDPKGRPSADLKRAVSTTHGAWAGKPDPDNRAAQILSFVCRDAQYEPRIRAVYERYRSMPEGAVIRPLGNPSWIPQRHWVLFYLGRTLGNLRDPRSVDSLLASMKPELNEARHGRPDPSEPNIHFLQLEYTPCWRASAAWALGRIGDGQAARPLVNVVADLNNATDVRYAAAEALGRVADPDCLEAMKQLAENYPEISTKRALQAACQKASEIHHVPGVGMIPPVSHKGASRVSPRWIGQ